MKRIFKYEISVGANMLPLKCNVISIQVQGNKLCAWAEVDEDNTETEERFIAIHTGMVPPKEGAKYAGTYLLDNGSYVLHVYDMINKIVEKEFEDVIESVITNLHTIFPGFKGFKNEESIT